MRDDVVIQVDKVSKEYRLYDSKRDRLKEALSISHKQYSKTFHALKDISFDVKRGETVGIIGSNGSGKSTLLKILTGVISASSGEMKVNGKISALLELGAGFNPEYTGIENIYLNGIMMGYSEEEMAAKIDSIVDFAQIGEHIHQPLKTYSSGMFARLAFAVAINVEPDILIVDEALSVGDVFFQNKCFRKFAELQDKGVTILFVSHDIESVKQMCSRAIWIEKGQQKMVGDSKEVCNAYARSILLKSNEEASTIEIEHGSYQKKHFELSEYPFISSSKESLLNNNVKILSCVFQNMGNEITYNLRGGETYILSVIFETKIPIDKCIVGFVLQNKKGVSLLNINSLISGEKKNFAVSADTINKVDFKFKLPYFAEDEYVIDCAIADGISVMDNVMLTWVYGASQVYIENREEVLGLLGVDTEISVYTNKCI